MRTPTIEERVDQEIALMKQIPLAQLKRHNLGIGVEGLHQFPCVSPTARPGCWLERYSALHELTDWTKSFLHLMAAGVSEERARWHESQVYEANDQAAQYPPSDTKGKEALMQDAEDHMREFIKERIIAAECMDKSLKLESDVVVA